MRSYFNIFIFVLLTCPLATLAKKNVANPSEVFVCGEMPAYVFYVSFQGQVRSLAKPRQKFLTLIGQSVVELKPILDLYEKEILVTNLGIPMWLPIQKQVLPVLSEKVKKGEGFLAFTQFVGHIESGSPLYLMIDFLTLEEEMEMRAKESMDLI